MDDHPGDGEAARVAEIMSALALTPLVDELTEKYAAFVSGMRERPGPGTAADTGE